MKHIRPFAAIISALLIFGIPLSGAQAGSPYLPLARVEITALDTELEELVRGLNVFAGQRNLTIRRGDFPKQGQRVLNIGLYFQADSFFVINNFTRPDRLTLVAYSHEEERTWRTTWNDLIARIAARLGNDRVLVAPAPAQQLPTPPPICDPLSVFFDSGSAVLKPEALIVITEAVRIVQQRQGRAHVTGHTDGLEGDDRSLAERRAAAVKQEMVRQGLSPQTIEILGVGFSAPLSPTAIGVPVSLNRRAQIDMPC
jgi:outer membrane protein OmpA-like peptidoglycan-associated protein